MKRLLFKVLNEDGSSYHGGTGKWPLPENGKPGEPLTVKGTLVPCRNGLHLCEPQHLVRWLGPTIWLAQIPEGVEEIRCDDKIVVRTGRLERRLETWNERTARHYACDCADRVAHLLTDPRSLEVLRVARLFADGLATRQQLDAAGVAARDAAGVAARDAAGAAWDAARDAAGVAARDAAGVAARDARAAARDARAAAGDAEYEWQTERLMRYLRGELP